MNAPAPSLAPWRWHDRFVRLVEHTHHIDQWNEARRAMRAEQRRWSSADFAPAAADWSDMGHAKKRLVDAARAVRAAILDGSIQVESTEPVWKIALAIDTDNADLLVLFAEWVTDRAPFGRVRDIYTEIHSR